MKKHKWIKKLSRAVLRLSVRRHMRHIEPSAICSLDDDVAPNEFLLQLGLQAAAYASQNKLTSLAAQHASRGGEGYHVFPGEHYRLLHALVSILQPARIVEIGTFTGMSAAAMREAMPAQSVLTTYDVVAWNQFNSHLTQADFDSGKIVQHLADLSDADQFSAHALRLQEAQLIFCDAPKDGYFEEKFLAMLSRLKPAGRCVLVLDDIRLLTMIDVWRAIASPKLDITSFGHFSGTGLVDITQGLVFRAQP